jgi:hypothetical protein
MGDLKEGLSKKEKILCTIWSVGILIMVIWMWVTR